MEHQNNNNLPQNSQNALASPELFEKFLDNQSKELAIKEKELALQKQQDDHGFEFGKTALLAKVEDRKLQREHELKSSKHTYILITALVSIVAAIIFYALYSNNTPIAMEIIKAIVYLAGGGLGGYGMAKANKSKDDDSNSTE